MRYIYKNRDGSPLQTCPKCGSCLTEDGSVLLAAEDKDGEGWVCSSALTEEGEATGALDPPVTKFLGAGCSKCHCSFDRHKKIKEIMTNALSKDEARFIAGLLRALAYQLRDEASTHYLNIPDSREARDLVYQAQTWVSSDTPHPGPDGPDDDPVMDDTPIYLYEDDLPKYLIHRLQEAYGLDQEEVPDILC